MSCLSWFTYYSHSQILVWNLSIVWRSSLPASFHAYKWKDILFAHVGKMYIMVKGQFTLFNVPLMKVIVLHITHPADPQCCTSHDKKKVFSIHFHQWWMAKWAKEMSFPLVCVETCRQRTTDYRQISNKKFALKSRMEKWETFPSPFQILVLTNSGTFLLAKANQNPM